MTLLMPVKISSQPSSIPNFVVLVLDNPCQVNIKGLIEGYYYCILLAYSKNFSQICKFSLSLLCCR